jgi:hypothetical protein
MKTHHTAKPEAIYCQSCGASGVRFPPAEYSPTQPRFPLENVIRVRPTFHEHSFQDIPLLFSSMRLVLEPPILTAEWFHCELYRIHPVNDMSPHDLSGFLRVSFRNNANQAQMKIGGLDQPSQRCFVKPSKN